MATAFADNFEELTGLTKEEFEAGKEITTDVIGTSTVVSEVQTKDVTAEETTVPDAVVETADVNPETPAVATE